MRQILGLLLLTALIPAVASGPAQWPKESGTVGESLLLRPIGTMDRVTRNGHVQGGGEIHVYGGRGETEAFQFVVMARGGDIERARVTASDLLGPRDARIGTAAIDIFREHEVTFTRGSPGAPFPPGSYPDALIPVRDPYTGEDLEGSTYDGQPFDLPSGQNQPIWVDVRIPHDARAGDYKGSITVRAANGAVSKLPFKLTVWDFELPLKPAMPSSFGYYRAEGYYGAEWGSREYYLLSRRYADALIDHRLAPSRPHDMVIDCDDDGNLIFPHDIGGLGSAREIIDYYVKQRGMSAVALPIWFVWPFEDPLVADRDRTIAYLRNYMNFAGKNQWNNRLYIYLIDEPNDAAAYRGVRQWGTLFNEAGLDFQFLVTEQPEPDDPEWGSLKGYVDIWCPLSAMLSKAQARDRLNAGDRLWTYTALVQDGVSPKWELDRAPIEYRIYPWIAYNYGISGLLYWETTYWNESPDPWKIASAYDKVFVGEGQLFYPGTLATVGFDGPVASMRLKWIREGMDDFDYFALLKSLGADKFLGRTVPTVASSWKEWTRDPDLLLGRRRRMGEQIQSLLSDRGRGTSVRFDDTSGQGVDRRDRETERHDRPSRRGELR